MIKRLALLPLLALLIVGATAGSKTIKNLGRDHMKVDGVRLEHSRYVELEGALDERLVIETGLGDIEIRGVDGDRARLRVEIYEYEPGDLAVDLSRDGRIMLDSDSGKPGAVGDVVAEIPRHLDIFVETGMGDIELHDLAGGDRIELATGMGTITLRSVSGYRVVDAASGKGDIRLGPADDLDDVELATGMGGIKLKDAQVERLDVSSGMGSINLLDCELGVVTGGTGMGSVHFKRTSYRDSDVSSGLGRVKVD